MLYVRGGGGQEAAGVEDYVCTTNGQTGVAMVQAADPLVCLCLGGKTSEGPEISRG